MSLQEAYTLAHSAQCRLHIATNRPDRNLRFVVGHLMHYEALRLRIVEIEHDVGRSQRERSSAVQFKGNTTSTYVDHRIRQKPSTGQLGRRSPPPPLQTQPAIDIYADDDDDDDDDEPAEDMLDDDDDDDAGLGLTRFPSGSAARPQPHRSHDQPPPPELDPDDDDEDDSDSDEAISPEEPDAATLAAAMQGPGNDAYAKLYNGVRGCVCHGKAEAPAFERMWELPGGGGAGDKKMTRMLAQVGDGVPEMRVCAGVGGEAIAAA